ncbi:hypothetical protein LEUCM_00457 [Leuconostoc suionicum]|nr:hypothetical protein LEUCM_00457 [Leuconostoc suionicum]
MNAIINDGWKYKLYSDKNTKNKGRYEADNRVTQLLIFYGNNHCTDLQKEFF